MFNSLLRWVGVGLSLLMGVSVHAMTFERVGDTLFASGPLEGDDFLRFQTHLKPGDLTRLVLVDAPGGDVWTALRVGEMIKDASLDTVAVGHCLSACTLLFVAGKNRAFGTGRHPGRTLLGIHGPHDRDTRAVNHRTSSAIYAFYKRQLGAAMDEQVMNQAIYRIRDASGFLLLPEMERNPQERRLVRFCPSLKVSDAACVVQEGKDALSLGLVTRAETVPVELPPSMVWRLLLMGETVESPEINADAHAEAVRRLMCGTVPCPAVDDLVRRWTQFPEHRAMAVTRDVAGARTYMGLSGGDVSPESAMARALFQCNHRGPRVELCEIVALDDRHVHDLTERWLEASRLAVNRLVEVATPSVEREKDDFCSSREVSRKRTVERGFDLPSPCSLKGVQRTDSALLVQALTMDEPWLVLDVSPDAQMLPGAVALLHAGLSFSDGSVEASYHQRFQALLWATAPDFDQPLVFYGGAGAGWLSANAALRAVELGYTQVRWYRGGLLAWQAAGLPSVRKVVQGVVH